MYKHANLSYRSCSREDEAARRSVSDLCQKPFASVGVATGIESDAVERERRSSDIINHHISYIFCE